MNNFKNYIFMAAGFAVLVAVVSGITAGPAVAALVKAALVQSVDEPGRNPFALSASGTGGSWSVPAGQRYVIEDFSVRCDVDATGAMIGGLLSTSSGEVYAPAFKGDSDGGSVNGPVNTWYSSGRTSAYANPSTQINFMPRTNVNSTGAVPESCVFSVSGHVINLP
jgi:hypothetical protein